MPDDSVILPLGFEPVLEVSEYFDGPRVGIAHFRGRPYRFRSRFADVYGDDEALDLFDLISVGGPDVSVTVAMATFLVAPDAPASEPGKAKELIVLWETVSDVGSTHER